MLIWGLLLAAAVIVIHINFGWPPLSPPLHAFAIACGEIGASAVHEAAEAGRRVIAAMDHAGAMTDANLLTVNAIGVAISLLIVQQYVDAVIAYSSGAASGIEVRQRFDLLRNIWELALIAGLLNLVSLLIVLFNRAPCEQICPAAHAPELSLVWATHLATLSMLLVFAAAGVLIWRIVGDWPEPEEIQSLRV